MQIIDNVTVYKCEHCNYTDTVKGRLLTHENNCLSEHLKKNKNTDKQEIYNILDIDIINIKIKEFLVKYSLPVSTELTYIYLMVGNSLNVDIEIEKSIRGIFDRSKFRIYNEIIKMRNTKEYINTSLEGHLKETERQILLKETEIEILLDRRKDITLESVKEYLKGNK
jgi:hypothetical protein